MNKVYQLSWITSLLTGLTRHKHTIKENKLHKTLQLRPRTFLGGSKFIFVLPVLPFLLLYFGLRFHLLFSWGFLAPLFLAWFFVCSACPFSLSRLPFRFTLASCSTSHPTGLPSWLAKPSLILFLANFTSFLASSFLLIGTLFCFLVFFLPIKRGTFLKPWSKPASIPLIEVWS